MKAERKNFSLWTRYHNSQAFQMYKREKQEYDQMTQITGYDGNFLQCLRCYQGTYNIKKYDVGIKITLIISELRR